MKPLIPKLIKPGRAGKEDKLVSNDPEKYVPFVDVVDHVWKADLELLEWYNEHVFILLIQKGNNLKKEINLKRKFGCSESKDAFLVETLTPGDNKEEEFTCIVFF